MAAMGNVTYSMNVSLDGYVEDAAGTIEFTTPSDEVHQAFNDQTRESAVLVYGRGVYEMMEPYWPDVARSPEGHDEVAIDFADAYVGTPRVVVSDSLEQVGEGVRLIRRAEAAAEVERLRAEPGGAVEVGGPTLAGSVLDLIDEFCPMVAPAVTGGGKPFFPPGAEKLELRLVEHRAFDSGAVWLRYQRVR